MIDIKILYKTYNLKSIKNFKIYKYFLKNYNLNFFFD